MYGPPVDVAGDCNARLEIADDYGDNCATMRCSLAPQHEGPHREEFNRDGPVIVTWVSDARTKR